MSDQRETTRTTVEVGREAWRQLKRDAAVSDQTVSSRLEGVLEDYYDIPDGVGGSDG